MSLMQTFFVRITFENGHDKKTNYVAQDETTAHVAAQEESKRLAAGWGRAVLIEIRLWPFE